METKFNFNSQVATDRSQSERLLALGLKKETADMSHTAIVINHKVQYMEHCSTPKGIDIPAWSLHRLMYLVFNSGATHVELFDDEDAYEVLIYNIEWRIKKGYFNKEYLV